MGIFEHVSDAKFDNFAAALCMGLVIRVMVKG